MKFITVTEFAKRQGVSVQYIRKLIRQGKIEATKVNKRLWLIKEESK
jgi:excisionase family DNA binding protein